MSYSFREPYEEEDLTLMEELGDTPFLVVTDSDDRPVAIVRGYNNQELAVKIAYGLNDPGPP